MPGPCAGALALVALSARSPLRRPRSRATGAYAGRAGLAERGGHRRRYYWFILVFTGAIFVARDGDARRVHRPLPQRRGGQREIEGPQVHGNTRLELAWTVAPVVVLILIAAFVFYKLGGSRTPEGAQPTAGSIEVQGHQFYWHLRLPERRDHDRTSCGAAGRPVVNLRSTAPDGRRDPQLWIPALNGKIDAIPGHRERDVVQADATRRELPGPVRRALRPPARHDGRRPSRSIDAERVRPRGSRGRSGAAARPERPTSARRPSRAPARSVTAWTGEGDIGPALTGNGLLEDEEHRRARSSGNGAGTMPAVGERLERPRRWTP